MEKKTIQVDPSFFSMKRKSNFKNKTEKKKEKLKDNELNTRSVKELLLDKLKEYRRRKTAKRKERKSFSMSNHLTNSSDKIHTNIIDRIKATSTSNIQIKSDPPYGIMKNESKPTYRQYIINQNTIDNKAPQKSFDLSNETKTYNEIDNTENKNVEVKIDNNNNNQNIDDNQEKRYEKIIKRKFILGKKNKTRKIGVLVNNSKMRSMIENHKLNMKGSKLKTVKNYLKRKNFIKHGSQCPNTLLREMYENVCFCGDVTNTNKNNIIHNFVQDDNDN